jgi:RNA polymerase sigma factor (sigma-70 family)
VSGGRSLPRGGLSTSMTPRRQQKAENLGESPINAALGTGKSFAITGIEGIHSVGTVSCTFGETTQNLPLYGSQTEASIIHRILEGQGDLFQDLTQPHLGVLRRVIRKRMGNDEDVDDVIQEALIKSFANLRKFRFEASFRTWLVRIAHNEAGQNWRKKFTAHRFTQDQQAFAELEATDPNGSPFNAYVRNQTTKSIRLALAGLPEKYRAVIRMRDIEERSIAEVAETMRLTIGAVKTRHRRGRLIMAGLLFGTKKSAARGKRV